MAVLADNFTAVFWIAVIPAFVSLAIIVFGVHEPERPARVRARCGPRCPAANLTRLSRIYWMMVGVAAIFTLARFSEAFLLLRAQSVGLAASLRADGDGGHEHRLYVFGLAGRRAVRPHRTISAS